jgi:Phage terminase large subunit
MPLLLPKSLSVFNDYTRVILLSGGRKAAKTMNAATNKMVRHCWENDGAVLGVIGKTIRNVSEGAWKDLVSFCIPGWVDANVGMQITVTPRMTGDSHMRYCRIKNMHGGESELQLHSLDHEQDVEDKFKSMRFSMIFLSEIDQFSDRRVLDILLDQLRLPGVAYEHHQFLADCNPPVEGEDHWVYSALVNDAPGNKLRVPNSKCYHFNVAENWFLDPAELKDLKEKYAYDRIKYARFIDSMWVKDTTTSYFDGVFFPNIHVIGKRDTPNKEEWEVLVPDENTMVLITGSDIGDINHCTTFLSSRLNDNGEVVFDIFDELSSIGSPISLLQYGSLMWKKVQKWDVWMKQQSKRQVLWRHWADSSIMRYRAAANSTDARVVYMASEGNILMRAAVKGAGSVMHRVNLAKRLIYENRLFFSITCTESIAWATYLRPGNSGSEPVAKDLRWRHIFDSATYAIAQEIPFEVERGTRPKKERGSLVMV